VPVRKNLAVHGLGGDIRPDRQVNSDYEDLHDATGRVNFVLANPPFNVNAVDKERLKDPRRAGPPISVRPAAHRQFQWTCLFFWHYGPDFALGDSVNNSTGTCSALARS